MTTRAKWEDGILTFYDPDRDHETVEKEAPVEFYDDFLGAFTAVPAAAGAESGCRWVDKIVLTLGTPTVAIAADAASGAMQCALEATAEEQEALCYMDDQRQFSLEQGLIVEMRARLLVVPTLLGEIVWGLAGDYVKGPDNVARSVWFTADGSGEVFCEKDDAGTDQSATSGVTCLATDWKVYRIDATDVTNILFFIDGVNVATGTTFGYVGTGANAILQPYFGCYKSGGAGLGTLKIDYVRIWQKRS